MQMEGSDSAFVSNPAYEVTPEDGFITALGKTHAVVV